MNVVINMVKPNISKTRPYADTAKIYLNHSYKAKLPLNFLSMNETCLKTNLKFPHDVYETINC